MAIGYQPTIVGRGDGLPGHTTLAFCCEIAAETSRDPYNSRPYLVRQTLRPRPVHVPMSTVVERELRGRVAVPNHNALCLRL